MALEFQTEHVLGLALVPVGRVHADFAMLGRRFSASGADASTCTQPASRSP